MLEDQQINQNSHEIVETAIRKPQKNHEKQLFKHHKAIKDAETKAAEEKIKKLHRKQERRRTRELRVKEQIKAVLKAEILKLIVDKGEIRGPAAIYELLDIHQNFESHKLVLTGLGGQVQQLYYVLNSIFEIYGDDLTSFHSRRQANPNDELSKKALNARELLIE